LASSSGYVALRLLALLVRVGPAVNAPSLEYDQGTTYSMKNTNAIVLAVVSDDFMKVFRILELLLLYNISIYYISYYIICQRTRREKCTVAGE
jgi:hypothetical protein